MVEPTEAAQSRSSRQAFHCHHPFDSSQTPSSENQQQSTMPQQPQSHPHQASSPQTIKKSRLRLSCDACAAAKVRCSKERPRCERCGLNNLNCVYGRSMKHGRGKSRRQADQSPTATASQQKSPALSIGRTHPHDLHNSLSDLQRSLSDLVQKLGPLGTSSPLGSGPVSGGLSMAGTAAHSSARPSTPEHLFDDLLDVDNNMDVGGAGLRGAEKSSPSQFVVPSDILYTKHDPDFPSHVDLDPASYGSMPFDTLCNSIEHGNFSPFESSTSRIDLGPHNCNVVANSTLVMLYFRLGSSTQGVQNLEQYLLCLRDAEIHVSQILKCPCAKHPRLVMLLASIVMEIIFRHQIAVRTGTSLALPSEPVTEVLSQSGSATVGISYPDSAWNQTLPATPESVKTGGYGPDEAEQESLRQMLILSSLKNIGPLVEEFVQAGRLGEHGLSQVHSALASCLKLELNNATKEVGEVAGMAMSHAHF